MKRSGILIVVILLSSLTIGCESGREEGIPSGPLPGAQTNEFRKAMEKAGDKMRKGQMGKKAFQSQKKEPAKPKEEEPSTPAPPR